jgi:hypothetical protein
MDPIIEVVSRPLVYQIYQYIENIRQNREENYLFMLTFRIFGWVSLQIQGSIIY